MRVTEIEVLAGLGHHDGVAPVGCEVHVVRVVHRDVRPGGPPGHGVDRGEAVAQVVRHVQRAHVVGRHDVLGVEPGLVGPYHLVGRWVNDGHRRAAAVRHVNPVRHPAHGRAEHVRPSIGVDVRRVWLPEASPAAAPTGPLPGSPPARFPPHWRPNGRAQRVPHSGGASGSAGVPRGATSARRSSLRLRSRPRRPRTRRRTTPFAAPAGPPASRPCPCRSSLYDPAGRRSSRPGACGVRDQRRRCLPAPRSGQ